MSSQDVLSLSWLVANIKYVQKARIVRAFMGKQSFKPDLVCRIFEEVLKYKWLQCEQAGRNIYADDDNDSLLSNKDQIIRAGKEWRERHWESFFAAAQQVEASAPPKTVLYASGWRETSEGWFPPMNIDAKGPVSITEAINIYLRKQF